MNRITTATLNQRLAGLLLLFGTGVVATVAYSLISDGGDAPATPAAQNPPSGTGTVIGGEPAPGATAAPVTGVFFISGSVNGLVPGSAKAMPLTVTNPNPWPIQVLTVKTGVAEPTSVSCSAGSLAVGDYAFDDGDAVLTAPANGTVSVVVPVQLQDSLTVDQTACQSATFALTFDGTAQQVTS